MRLPVSLHVGTVTPQFSRRGRRNVASRCQGSCAVSGVVRDSQLAFREMAGRAAGCAANRGERRNLGAAPAVRKRATGREVAPRRR